MEDSTACWWMAIFGTCTVFNDRYGMERLYYHQADDTVYFAAEAKAILAVRPNLRSIDARGLGEFVSCGAVLENRSLFHGVHVLPPGSAWVFRKGQLDRRSKYFDAKSWEQQDPVDLNKACDEVRSAFAQNLPRYFEGEQRIGFSLTGGLDTRMVLAARRPQPDSLPCYTFGSMFRENHDVRVARRLAEACGQSHHVFTVAEEFLSQFPNYAERALYLTDGCVEVNRAPDLYLNEKVRELAPVRMTGNYGGKSYVESKTFKPVTPLEGLFAPAFHADIEQAAKTYVDSAQGNPISFAVFKQGPWYLHGILSLEQTQLSMRSPFLDNDLVRAIFRLPHSALADNALSLQIIADGDKNLLRIPTDRGIAGSYGKLPAIALT